MLENPRNSTKRKMISEDCDVLDSRFPGKI